MVFEPSWLTHFAIVQAQKRVQLFVIVHSNYSSNHCRSPIRLCCTIRHSQHISHKRRHYKTFY